MHKLSKFAVILFLFVYAAAVAQNWPSAPQPQPSPTASKPPVSSNDYAAGFSFDNQLYALQGGVVSLAVGTMTGRPWLGLASGVGSCAIYRIIHIQGYHNDKFFGQNRIEFCAAGSIASYGVMKLMHVRRSH